MNNPQRGEASLTGPEGKEYTLCLTLGAIAMMEEKIEGLESLADIETVFGDKPKMRDLLTILICLLHGGGHTEIQQQDLMSWDVKLPALMEAIKKAFAGAGINDDEEAGDKGSGN